MCVCVRSPACEKTGKRMPEALCIASQGCCQNLRLVCQDVQCFVCLVVNHPACVCVGLQLMVIIIIDQSVEIKSQERVKVIFDL